MGYSKKKKVRPFLVAVEPQGGVVWGPLSVVWAADMRTAHALAVEPFMGTDKAVIVVPMTGHAHGKEED